MNRLFPYYLLYIIRRLFIIYSIPIIDIFLYLIIFTITISGALKKLLGGEKLNIFISKIKIQSNFELAEMFYEVHIYANYTLIALISLHICAVIIHKIIFKENILRKIT